MKVPLSADFIQNNASGSVQVGKSGYIIVLFQKVITTFEKFFLFWVPMNNNYWISILANNWAEVLSIKKTGLICRDKKVQASFR